MGGLPDDMKLFTGITAVTVVFLIAASIVMVRNRTISRDARNTFLVSFAALALISLADWFTTLTNGQFPELRGLHAFAMAFTFSLAPMIPVVISNTIFPEKAFKLILGMFCAHAVLQFASIFGGFIFSVDELNYYHRGPLYPIYVFVYTLSSLYLVVESIRASRVYQAASILVLLGIFACLATGVVIQIVDPSVRTTWPAVSMSVVLYAMFYTDMVLRTDALTKLLNRHSYEEFLSNPPLPCRIVVIDVDDFKSANDTYGHAFGDVCLETIADSIKRTFGSVGLCYRTGGDEFVVVMTKQLEDVEKLKGDLVQAVEKRRESESRLPSVSVGYALAEKRGSDTAIADVIEAADRAMYQSKSEGKSRR